VTLQFDGKFVSAKNELTGGAPSDFSSWGPTPNLEIKPDLAGIGGNVFSSIPVAQGSYDVYSGTSMSSPYVAGAAVLLRQLQKNAQFADLQKRSLNTAKPAVDASVGMPWSVTKQGAGLVDVHAMIATEVAVTPTKLELKDGGARRSAALTVTNAGKADVTYTVGHTAAAAVNMAGKFDLKGMVTSKHEARVAFSTPQQLTVRAGASEQVQLTVTPSADAPPFTLQSGYITLTPAGDAKAAPKLSVPYLLMTGNYADYPVVSLADPKDLPAIAETALANWDIAKCVLHVCPIAPPLSCPFSLNMSPYSPLRFAWSPFLPSLYSCVGCVCVLRQQQGAAPRGRQDRDRPRQDDRPLLDG
jgi:minor extracellular serine protease Vpr